MLIAEESYSALHKDNADKLTVTRGENAKASANWKHGRNKEKEQTIKKEKNHIYKTKN